MFAVNFNTASNIRKFVQKFEEHANVLVVSENGSGE